MRKLMGPPGGAGGKVKSKDPDDNITVTKENDMMIMGMVKNLVMRIDKPEDEKPTYINMSPVYDFRGGYLI